MAPSVEMDDSRLLQSAADHLAAGRFAQSERECLDVLSRDSVNAQALDLLGHVESRLGRPDEAIERHLAAARVRAEPVELLQQNAADLRRSGRFAEAVALYRRAEEQYPNRAQVPFVLGNAWREWGRLDRAVEAYTRAVRLDPGYVKAHNNLGYTLWQLGRQGEAITAMRAARDLVPDSFEAQINLGTLLGETGELTEAAECVRAALRLRPGADSATRLAVVLTRQGRSAEALAMCQGALAHHPAFVPALDQAARILINEARWTEAEEYVQRALQVTPVSPDTLQNLANLRRSQGAIADAVRAYEEVITIDPQRVEALVNLGNLLWDLGRDEEGTECFRRAIAAAPDSVHAHYNLGNSLMAEGQAPEALAHFRTAHALDPRDRRVHSNLLYCLYFCPGISMADIGREHRQWDALHAAELRPPSGPPAARPRGRRIRVGYVSADFREHPVARFLLPILEQHDQTEFEVFAYASVITTDAVTARCRAAVHVWRDVAGWSDERVAELVRADGIDILIDLSMHMADHRLLVFARKPAPVQVTYLAYCGTTGLSAIDYRITDPYLDPLGTDLSVYSEQTVFLPESYWCYRPLLDVPVSARPQSEAVGRVTFGCLNNFAKASDAALTAWAELLRAVPESRLVLSCPTAAGRRRVANLMVCRGVSEERLSFLGGLPPSDYLQAYASIDVALDPFPYGGDDDVRRAVDGGAGHYLGRAHRRGSRRGQHPEQHRAARTGGD